MKETYKRISNHITNNYKFYKIKRLKNKSNILCKVAKCVVIKINNLK